MAKGKRVWCSHHRRVETYELILAVGAACAGDRFEVVEIECDPAELEDLRSAESDRVFYVWCSQHRCLEEYALALGDDARECAGDCFEVEDADANAPHSSAHAQQLN